jgi:hypothetical protein
MSASRRKRIPVAVGEAPDRFRLQHGGVVRRRRVRGDDLDATHVNEAESPLAWLARRKDRDGRPFVLPGQLLAGERLRADFTRAGLTPRMTANWGAPVERMRGSGSDGMTIADVVIAAKERLARTLDAVGPEFAGLLLDTCCFLKGLETVERERSWPPRTARIVLSLALDRLARHYGIEVEARGPSRSPMRAWQSAGARPSIDGGDSDGFG